MESTAVQKIARALHILVTITLVCNLLALLLVPGLALMGDSAALWDLVPYEDPWVLPLRVLMVFALSWKWIWSAGAYWVVLSLFLLFAGVCTAVILRQARRVLKTILRGEPFSTENAVSLNRAAACAFLIAAAALARVIFGVCWYRSAVPLTTYNALFVPLFTLFGLLCRVMSALFRQAAELKAENDLTI